MKNFANGPDKNFPQIRGEDKKKSDIRKQRNNKDINIKDARGKRERTQERERRGELFKGLIHRDLPDPLEGDPAADEDPKMVPDSLRGR